MDKEKFRFLRSEKFFNDLEKGKAEILKIVIEVIGEDRKEV